MIDTAGFKISGRDVFEQPRRGLTMWMSGCRFEWIETRVEEELVQGTVIDDRHVNLRDKVGVFSWYRQDEKREKLERGELDPEKDVARDSRGRRQNGLVGIFFHGGAFTHNCAHPKSQSTVMPLTLYNRCKKFDSMHSVEFRLLPEYPFPAQLQDAVTVYIGLLKRGILAENIVLIGDSSGANIALSLSRWIRDTIRDKGPEVIERERLSTRAAKDGKDVQVRWELADPAGLILFSPWIDPAHSFLDCAPENYIRRTNSCDYILEEGPFRHHLVNNLLGPDQQRRRSFVLSPYLSPGRTDLPTGTFDGPNHAPCFISYGTGERGQAECERLVHYLERDGVEKVEVVVTKDTPHDILLLGFWKRDQRERIWRGALAFLASLPLPKERNGSE